jgi:hypothetical protein
LLAFATGLSSFLSSLQIIASAANGKGDDPDFIMDTDGVGHVDKSYVTSDQFLELGVPTSNGLRLEGENSLRTGDLDRAILVLQKSVEMAPFDMDGRQLYAEALEKKLAKEKGNDPVLFNFVVKQWLFMYKQSEFIDQKVFALSHINNLTGTAPKRFENEKKFLTRVLRPELADKPKVALKGATKSAEADQAPSTAKPAEGPSKDTPKSSTKSSHKKAEESEETTDE